MSLTTLTAISPVDGRYRSKVSELAPYFSEYGLIKYRVHVEVEYFIALVEAGIGPLKTVSSSIFPALRAIVTFFSEEDALAVKNIEKTTNHDVKAVEYFLKEKMQPLGLENYLEFIHFGLTSQDINNTAIPLSLKEAVKEVYIPVLEALIGVLKRYMNDWSGVALLARTHGQPASPTILGKEIGVFVYRLETQLEILKHIPYAAKFGGATGNFNAHQVAFPETDWVAFSNKFVNEQLGLNRSQLTTQIENYDQLANLFDCLKRINTIILDLNRDMWTYISMDYFKQKLKEGEVGSSAMPHKVNPIDFENSEGNIGIANALYEHLAAKLPVSRLQRDLTDSTVLRAVGMPLAHSLVAFKATVMGLNKLLLNEQAIREDLEANWAVVAEAIQTILRSIGFPKPYEALKGLTRKNEKVTQQTVHDFIDTLGVDAAMKVRLKEITPANYTGVKLV
ncbi:adenylosuccinate lyase [Fluviicola sp.]|jgi:adenylosuccinate lyase|uniref:adenylosuccinate lyase n=1 Tax=Fluviicola sp. TaxID=1917219 RepID=UPI0028223962|nr:adenylosuccinate lyase [Fluviicola sp.]MDR0803351.1 adenylosuccinate lyase [Fluviicola sp.]